MEKFSALIGLLGVLLGAIGTYWFQHSLLRQQHDQARIEIKRSRGEELYVLFDKWQRIIEGEYPTLLSVMKGEMSYDDHFDSIIESRTDAKFDPGRMQMLIEVYFEGLKSNFGTCEKALFTVNKITGRHKAAYKAGDTNGIPFLDEYTNALLFFGKNCDSFKAQLAEKLRGL